ncbi:MAG: hypothetical protein M0D57_06880 [Sphingobacteriales bacterium JAD_PAG50586_3]|nr:MAG: hypothetical protein M0D57_06880 [Sphingobacteriales bacterium JAD_PAG50586_3]
MKKLVVLVMAAAIGLFACKKDDEKTVPHVDNMPLAVGNYWVYQVFNVDSDDVATPTADFDTCRITGTQTINGKTYFNFENYPLFQNNQNLIHLRDSMGYLVD